MLQCQTLGGQQVQEVGILRQMQHLLQLAFQTLAPQVWVLVVWGKVNLLHCLGITDFTLRCCCKSVYFNFFLLCKTVFALGGSQQFAAMMQNPFAQQMIRSTLSDPAALDQVRCNQNL
jgi:hypothetical protein